MNHSVENKQPNSTMCLVCGLENPFGLRASFFELDNAELVALFTPHDVHQGYPGRLHGGIVTGLLDETIGRAIMMKHKQDYWGVTVEFTTRFKKPIPLNVKLRVVGRITRDTERFFEGSGEILLPGGEVAATGIGKYMKLPLEKIAAFDTTEAHWRVTKTETDPTEIDLP